MGRRLDLPTLAPACLVVLAPAVFVVLGQPASADDTVPPTIVERVPAPGAVGVAVDLPLTVTFSEPLDPETVGGQSVYLQDGSKRVPASVLPSEDGLQAELDPTNDLRPGAIYSMTVVGGPAGAVTDLAGNPLEQSSRWTFTTNRRARVLVRSPDPGAITRDRTPRIRFRVRDEEPVAKSAVTVTVDGESRRFRYDDGTGKLCPRLPRGEHTVLVTATDALGEVATRSWSFTVR